VETLRKPFPPSRGVRKGMRVLGSANPCGARSAARRGKVLTRRLCRRRRIPDALIALALLLPLTTRILSRHDESYRDNWDLPLGPRIAVIVSGLGKKGVLEHALRSLQTNVVDAMGRDRVHVFLHIESRGFSSAEVYDVLTQNLDPSNLKRFAINDSSALELNAPPLRIQLDRLRAGFQLVLAEERMINERYGWVCRVRTDTFWLAKWKSQMLAKLVPQTSIVAGDN
jgi:hypothetical protein